MATESDDSTKKDADPSDELVARAVELLKHEYVIANRQELRTYFFQLVIVALGSGTVTIAAVWATIYTSASAQTNRLLAGYATEAKDKLDKLKAITISSENGETVITGNLIVRPDLSRNIAPNIRVVGGGGGVDIQGQLQLLDTQGKVAVRIDPTRRQLGIDPELNIISLDPLIQAKWVVDQGIDTSFQGSVFANPHRPWPKPNPQE